MAQIRILISKSCNVKNYPQLRVDGTDSVEFADPMGGMAAFGGGEAR